MNERIQNRVAGLLGSLFVTAIVITLGVVGFSPTEAVSGPRWAGSSGGGGVVPPATCSTNGGVLYATGGAFTCNTALTTNGAGAVSASASVTSPIVQSASNLSIRSNGASTDAATVANNLFTFNGPSSWVSGGTTVISLNPNSGGAAAGTASITVGTGSGSNTGITCGTVFSGLGGCWSTAVGAPSATNFMFYGAAGSTVINAPSTSLQLDVANSLVATVSATGFSALGTNTNNSASAGQIGEFINSSVASSGAVVTVSSNTPVTVVSTGATVTAGNYDVQGLTCYISAAATSFTVYKQGISTTTNTFGALGSYTSSQFAAMVPLATTTSENCQLTPTTNIKLSGTSNVFLVAAPVFSVSGTITAYGFIRLLRVR